MTQVLHIATRKSPLALWQAEHVKACLQAIHPDLQVELLAMTTEGDRFLNSPLASVGGKGLFVKELEQCLLEGKADIAVHSIKDVTVDFPEGLHMPIIMEREDPRDAFISSKHQSLINLPKNACIGTSSMRRQCQIKALRPDLEIKDLRGNVNTRLRKLDEGQYDAIILAAAGMKRLAMEERIQQYIDTKMILPAIGQAAIGIECRTDDKRVVQLLAPLQHEETAIRIKAERTISQGLYGGCQLPIAAFAEIDNDKLHLQALVGQIDGSEIIRDEIVGDIHAGVTLAKQLTEQLLSKGAGTILEAILNA